MKLWEKGLNLDSRIEAFTIGSDREIDLYIAPYDVKASMAHAIMLAEVDLISKEEAKTLVEALEQIEKNIENGEFTIDNAFEDVHSKIEYELINSCGDVGKKIHTARSRNDQVMTALHLFYKEALNKLYIEVKQLFELLLNLAEKNKDKFLPGYTHFQQAMPSSFGLWFSSYAELLIDDIYLLKAAFQTVDQNPLGSSAGYGSTFPINREFTTQELGFGELKYNVIAAQLARGKSEASVSFFLSSIAKTLNKFSADICIYMSQEFNFIGFPDELTTGSSIMPHKKNPDLFELVRAKCNKIQAYNYEVSLITTNLSSGYHRDFQILKEGMINALLSMEDVLTIFKYAIEKIQIKEIDGHHEKYKSLYTVNGINSLIQQGVPFREAYARIAEDVLNNNFEPDIDQSYTHLGSIGNLCLNRIRKKFPDL